MNKISMADKSYIGKVCPKHPQLNGERSVSAKDCRECAKERARSWYKANTERAKRNSRSCALANKDRRRAIERLRYQKNREQIVAYHRAWRAANKKRDASHKKAWAEKNQHMVMAATRRNQAKKRRAVPAWVDHRKIAELYAEAVRRSKTTGIKHHVDHIVPLNSPLVCGLHWHGNLRVVTAKENMDKRNWHWPDMPGA